MQTCIIEIAYGAVAVGPSNRKPPAGLTCTVLEKVFRPVCYRLKRRSIIFVRKFSRRKCSCVDDKTFVLLRTGLTIFPVSCPKSVSQRDTAVSSQKRPKSVLDTDDPYHVACLRERERNIERRDRIESLAMSRIAQKFILYFNVFRSSYRVRSIIDNSQD